MADYVVEFTGRNNLSQAAQGVKKDLEGINNEAGKVGENVSKYDAFAARFEKISNSTKPLKAQLGSLKRLLADMNMEEAFDDHGLMTQVAQRAGEIKDAMADANDAINRFSSDTQTLDASLQAFQLGAAGASTLTGALGLLGVESENVNNMILKVQSSLAILNGVQQISNILNKDSALMQTLKAAKLKIVTAAQKGNNVATATGNVIEGTSNNLKKVDIALTTAEAAKTTIATTAQNAWNVAKAIGMAMLGNMTGLILLGVAGLTAYAMATDSSTEKIKEQTEAEKRAAEEKKSFNDTLNSTYADLMGSYTKLRTEWKKLSSDQERSAWIKQHKSELESLGAEVKNAKDAEDFLVKNTDSVVDSFRRKAKAAAYFQAMVKAYERQLEIEEQAEETLSKYSKQRGDKANWHPTYPEAATWNGQHGTSKNGEYESFNGGVDWVYTAKGAQAYNKALWEQNAALKELSHAYDENNAKIAEYEKKYGELAESTKSLIKPSGNSNDTKKAIAGSIDAMNAEIALLQSNLRKGLIPKDKIEEAKKRIKDLQDQVKSKEIELGLKVVAETGSINEIQERLKALEDKKLTMKATSDFTEINKQIAKTKAELKQAKIQVGLEAEEGSLDAIKAELDELLKKRSSKFLIGADLTLLNKQIEAKQKELERKEIELGLKPKIDRGSVADIEKQISEIDNQLKNQNLTIPARMRLEESKAQLQAQIDKITQGDLTIKARIEPTRSNQRGDLFDMRASRENAQKAINQIVDDFDAGIISSKQMKTEIAALNSQLEAMGMKKIYIDIETNLDKVQAGFDNFMNNMNAIDGAVNSFDRLTQAINEDANAWEIIMATLSTVQGVIAAVNAVMEITNMLSAIGTVNKTGEAVAAQAAATSNTELAAVEGAAVAPKTAETVANRALEASILDLAAAQIFAAHASIPFAGVGIAAGLIASMMAAMAAQHAASLAMMAFKEGGIVGGSASEHPILAHKGEMVLNEKQQKNLFNAIDKNRISNNGGVVGVVGRVRGKDIELVLENNKRSNQRAGINLKF